MPPGGTPGTTGDGYAVDIPALEAYVGKLANYEDQSSKITELVGRADVGDQSWGLVGLATKSSYTDTLHSLRELLGAMTEGLRGAGDKMSDVARTYQGQEDDHVVMFNDIGVPIDGPRP